MTDEREYMQAQLDTLDLMALPAEGVIHEVASLQRGFSFLDQLNFESWLARRFGWARTLGWSRPAPNDPHLRLMECSAIPPAEGARVPGNRPYTKWLKEELLHVFK